MKRLFLNLIAFALVLSFTVPVESQQVRRRRPRPNTPAAPTDSYRAVDDAVPDFNASLLLGTPPAFWEIDADRRDKTLRESLRQGSVAPPAPAKVTRYAAFILARYDKDGDGVLSESEWKAMPGSPQSIDIDGDLRITFDELVRHLAVYGERRTIHRPHPAPLRQVSPLMTQSLQLFRPLDPPPPGTLATPDTPLKTAATDITEHDLDATDQSADDKSLEAVTAGQQIPQERKYYRSPADLRGLPAWFILQDRDGDGQLTLLEFAPSLSPASIALFGRLDKNGDGILTADEVRGRTGGAAPENLPASSPGNTVLPPEPEEQTPTAPPPPADAPAASPSTPPAVTPPPAP